MTESDIPAVASIVGESMNEEEGKQAYETLRFHFACQCHAIDDGRSYHVLVDERGVQGVVGLHRYLWGPPENVWLAWFAVNPESRGTGLGKRLMDTVLQQAAQSGYEKLLVETYSTPEFADARMFYQAKGFVPAGIVASYLPNGGDMIVYSKDLTPNV